MLIICAAAAGFLVCCGMERGVKNPSNPQHYIIRGCSLRHAIDHEPAVTEVTVWKPPIHWISRAGHASFLSASSHHQERVVGLNKLSIISVSPSLHLFNSRTGEGTAVQGQSPLLSSYVIPWKGVSRTGILRGRTTLQVPLWHSDAGKMTRVPSSAETLTPLFYTA